ncbi:hypothetical protein PHLGIDRAFT_80473 [Phlebiopsis gigantea 11061_1 CR5-6]|uniref:CxC2-like cysteine cluster KDZ transposase-associated domain-containing protein n=1 Tax=Phlebiopsis gigantea (strain 11061_1 CR5-6) TaxID=745531 RepID=A0A0C3NAJ1_PHLG1|nr:hypothetical protein PHLGIDRAFT_80473 [Phlebiopsis gigantea 11061_1 CR5-6]
MLTTNIQEQDAFLREWHGHVDTFVAEMLRNDGLRGYNGEECSHCGGKMNGERVLRCKDCTGGALMCARCCVTGHADNPFHRVVEWNGRFFEKTTLRALGLVIQVGHLRGSPCKNPRAGPCNFMAIHTNGFHPVSIQFCGCDQVQKAGNRVEQLLRFELYPATIGDPSTCFTFQVLEHFHLLTLQSKTTAYDFYRTLQYITNNPGVDGMKFDRLKSFMRVAREWRHLKMLKRFGRGHESSGTKGTRPGELVLQCPACPRPGYNLPENWESVSNDMKFLYTMVIAIDANFRLKRRAVSSEERDPALGSGWGHFVENSQYHQHLLNHAQEDDMSTCTGFQALAQKNTRFSAGYATTGVGMAIDGRHGFILPNGVGDLQKGERYCNMDYIVASTLSLVEKYPPLVLSYDIACQWSIHLRERLAAFPAHLRIDLPSDGPNLRYAIPKYHFNAHKNKDHNKYSLNFLKVGRTDGEEVERNWAHHNQTAGSTREMGPGSRQGTLEDHFGYANWRKFADLSLWLAQQRWKCRQQSAEQREIFVAFQEKVPKQKRDDWIAEVVAWEDDPSLPDPYYHQATGISEAEIRRRLVEEDEATAMEGTLSLHEVTPASMVIELLEIEDQQRKFHLRYPKNAALPTTMERERLEKRGLLRRRITTIREVQAVYMSCVPQLLARIHRDTRIPATSLSAMTSGGNPRESALRSAAPPASSTLPEDECLFLPYQLTSDQLALCTEGLAAIEERLRDAQLHDSLDKLRIQLHIKSRMVGFKHRHVRNQRPNECIRRQINVNDQKVKLFSEKYRAARTAKHKLAGPGDWECEYRILKNEDVRTMVAEDDPVNQRAAEVNAQASRTNKGKRKMVSEGKRKTSWIWLGAAVEGEGAEAGEVAGLSDALKQEFLKARARTMRFQEHSLMLVEEYRRVLVSLDETALLWDRREGEARQHEHDPTAEGKAAYAARQSMLQRQLRAKTERLWDMADEKNIARRTKASALPPRLLVATSSMSDDEDEDLCITGYGEDIDE